MTRQYGFQEATTMTFYLLNYGLYDLYHKPLASLDISGLGSLVIAATANLEGAFYQSCGMAVGIGTASSVVWTQVRCIFSGYAPNGGSRRENSQGLSGPARRRERFDLDLAVVCSFLVWEVLAENPYRYPRRRPY